MDNDKNIKNNNHYAVDRRGNKPVLPDFDTLRDLARDDPAGLERLRLALCQKVIDEAPPNARPRLEGLMFQINARRQLAKTDLEACQDISSMMNESLRRMQAMLKDLRTIQSESILLSTRNQMDNHHDRPADSSKTCATARVLPFAKIKKKTPVGSLE